MKRRLRRAVLLPALLLYTGLLFAAATPDEIMPDIVEPASEAARDVFRALHVRPFAWVFGGPSGNMKRRTLMISAHAELPDGTLERVYAVPDAPLEGFQWVQPAAETAIYKALVLSPANKLTRVVSKNRRRSSLLRLRRSLRITRLSRFFCHSRHAAGGRAERIYVTLHLEGISYRTGWVHAQTHTVQVYDCHADRRLSPQPWPSAELGPDGTPRPLPDVPDPLFVRPVARDPAAASSSRSRPGPTVERAEALRRLQPLDRSRLRRAPTLPVEQLRPVVPALRVTPPTPRPATPSDVPR